MNLWDPEDRIDRSPTLLSSALALAAGVFAVTANVGAPVAALICVLGVLALGAGLLDGRQVVVTAGTGLLVLGSVVGGTQGVPVLATLVGVAAGLLAFDLGSTAVSLGDQLGRETDTRQVELVHATASTLVGGAFVGAGFAIRETVSGGQPLSGVLGLVAAVLLLIAALRRADPVR
jgi:hypothetical protein